VSRQELVRLFLVNFVCTEQFKVCAIFFHCNQPACLSHKCHNQANIYWLLRPHLYTECEIHSKPFATKKKTYVSYTATNLNFTNDNKCKKKKKRIVYLVNKKIYVGRQKLLEEI